MAEYIERKAAIDVIMSEPTDDHYPSWYADKIKSISAADVATVRHGQWEKYFDGAYLMCSCCKASFWCEDNSEPTKYCPDCGAKMDGENNE